MPDNTLRQRDRMIVDFVVRYRLATNAIIGAQILPGRSLNAVAKVTARLCNIGLLKRYMLVPPENYFRAGARAINVLGLPQRSCESLGPQSLPIDYATLIYATKPDAKRRRLTPEEVTEYMPWLPSELSHSPYCVDAKGNLDHLRVDLGGSPQHVARKVAAAAHDRLLVPQIAELSSRSKFQVVVLTTGTEKANAIAKAIGNTDCSDQIRIRLAIVPRLSFLLLRSN